MKIPKGRGGKGWFYFGKSLEELLPLYPVRKTKLKNGAAHEHQRNHFVGRQSFAEVVKSQVAMRVEDLCLDHGSSGDALRRGNETGSDGPIGNALTLFGDKSAFSDKELGEACEKLSEGPYFNRTLRIELSNEGGRKVYWVLMRKSKKESSTEAKLSSPGPIKAIWMPKRMERSDGWINRAQSPLSLLKPPKENVQPLG